MTMYTESLRAFLKPVLPYLDDSAVSEIMINGPEDVWIEKKGRLTKTDAKFSEEGLLGAARNMAQFVGRMLNEERPRLDARLPDGSRIHVVLPPIARKGTTISIRKFFKDKLTIDALIKYKSMTTEMARLIDAGIHTKLNMLVSGGTGSGKTTLLNIVSSLIPDDERILTIEDSAELQLNQTHIVPFESRPPDKFGKGGVDMGDLLASALRLRPDRIVVGEVRGGEAFYLVQAMNTGHGGSLATTHANTPTDTLRRIESLCLMSSIDLPMVAVRAQVASAINFVICCERLHDGSRKTIALSEVLPLNEKGEYRTQDIFVFTPVTKDAEGHVIGYHAPTGVIPTFVAKAKAYGFDDLNDSFFDPATYGLPPPPFFRVGTEYEVRWAPSLKHREKGDRDPDSFKTQWDEFEKKLKVDWEEQQKEAKAKEAAAPAAAIAKPAAVPDKKASVQVPANAPVPAKTPTPAGGAKPVAAKAPAPSDDVTPPPTRNPLLAKKEEPAADEEPKVQVADDLLVEQGEVSTDLRPAQARKPGAVPARPGANVVRGSGTAVPVRRPAPAPAKPPAADEVDDSLLDDAGDDDIPDSEKTNVRAVPDRRR
ncbi:MAG: CpaF family protein [Myxococcaceae bacterium]